MNKIKIPKWLEHAVGALGGGGLFLVAFFDSSILSFPFVTDALVMELSIQKPARMPYYAAMAAVGSLAGCIWLYLLARKGGEGYFHKRTGDRADRIRKWVDNNAFLSVAVPAILPPPTPFKLFVIAAGVFQVPLKPFLLALVLGRGARYTLEGILAVRYGQAVLPYLMAHSGRFVLAVLALLILLYAIGEWLFAKKTIGS